MDQAQVNAGPFFLPELMLAGEIMKETVEVVEVVGLWNGVMIGGRQVNAKIRECAGADAYGDDAMGAVNPARKWIEGS